MEPVDKFIVTDPETVLILACMAYSECQLLRYKDDMNRRTWEAAKEKYPQLSVGTWTMDCRGFPGKITFTRKKEPKPTFWQKLRAAILNERV